MYSWIEIFNLVIAFVFVLAFLCIFLNKVIEAYRYHQYRGLVRRIEGAQSEIRRYYGPREYMASEDCVEILETIRIGYFAPINAIRTNRIENNKSQKTNKQ